MSGQDGVDVIARGAAGEGANAPGPVLFRTDAETFLANGELQKEIFGAASLIVRYAEPASLEELIAALEGQLTVTVQASPSA